MRKGPEGAGLDLTDPRHSIVYRFDNRPLQTIVIVFFVEVELCLWGQRRLRGVPKWLPMERST